MQTTAPRSHREPFHLRSIPNSVILNSSDCPIPSLFIKPNKKTIHNSSALALALVRNNPSVSDQNLSPPLRSHSHIVEHRCSVGVIGQLCSGKRAYTICLGLGLCRKQRRGFLLIGLKNLVAGGLWSVSAGMFMRRKFMETHLFLD